MRLDDIWMNGQNAKSKKRSPKEPIGELRDEAAASDPKGVMRVLRGLTVRASASKKKR